MYRSLGLCLLYVRIASSDTAPELWGGHGKGSSRPDSLGYRSKRHLAKNLDTCINGPCSPGNEKCGKPYSGAAQFHLMNQDGCFENDPSGPVFDPVHGVIHHFYQIHLAADLGMGPDWGHFVSKDFVHWAALPVAIWNGLDSSDWPPRKTPYDNEAIYTGSAVVVDGAGPGGKGLGIVQIYPGLCTGDDWPKCSTGTVLAQAVPAAYAADVLLTNWTKPSYNPIVEGAGRDPSTPWKTPTGEWRLSTFDSKVYGTTSDADMIAGKWFEIGTNPDFVSGECPSLYPLPRPTTGFEAEYNDALQAGTLPTHVHKWSAGYNMDWWQAGTYSTVAQHTTGNFTSTPGWEDLFAQKLVDQGDFYASKDNEYPTKNGAIRRINWGWADTPPGGAQSLPREITFNPVARCLEQAPIEELMELREDPLLVRHDISLGANKSYGFSLAHGVVKQSEVVATFLLPEKAATFGVLIGRPGSVPGIPFGTLMSDFDMNADSYNTTHFPPNTDPRVCGFACFKDDRCTAWTLVDNGDDGSDCLLRSELGCPSNHAPCLTCTSGVKTPQFMPQCDGARLSPTVACTISFEPPQNASAQFYEVSTRCGDITDTLRLVATERTVELRVFADHNLLEAYFQKGRVAMTVAHPLSDVDDIALTSSGAVFIQDVSVFPMRSIWTTADRVRMAPRVYPAINASEVAFSV